MAYEFKFKENDGAYTKQMLDTVPDGWGMTLRDTWYTETQKDISMLMILTI